MFDTKKVFKEIDDNIAMCLCKSFEETFKNIELSTIVD